MIGAIIGDIAGSVYEFHNIKTKEFELLPSEAFVTDDSVMSLAVSNAILKSKGKYEKLGNHTVKCMQELGKKYPYAGYGGMFKSWLQAKKPEPYFSFGNGAAMRVSACAYAADTLEEALELSDIVTGVTHNHTEGLKAARAVTEAIYMALHGSSQMEIEEKIRSKYYEIGFTLDEIRETYSFDVTCQGSVPQALEAFFEAESFEDSIRNAVSIGGDSDTIAAITGGIAEAYFGVPTELRVQALAHLDEKQMKILNDYECRFGYILARKVDSSMNRVAVKPGNIKKKGSEADRALMIATITDAPAEKLTSTQMFNHLYKACDIVRGPINQDDYKTYIIPLLFLKRVSDVYDEETAIAEAKYGEDIDLYDEEELHKFMIPEGCHWTDIRERSENIGEAIVNSMMAIESANPESMSGLFSSFDEASWTDKKKLTDERLKELIEHMSSIKVGNNDYTADIMGDAYEYLLKKFADLSKKNAGEVYTPRTLVKLCVMLLDPKPGDTCYDPACGTGGMLIEAIRHIKEKGTEMDTYGKMYAQEKNLSTSAIARMNLFLHGASDFHIVQGDTLRYPGFTEGDKLKTFKCTIANPPFSLSKWGSEAWAADLYGRNIWGTPSDSSADFAWLQHMVASMDPESGRCAVILPQGVLFHGGKEGEIRKQLVLSDKIEAIINLAGGLFYGAGVSACIIFMNNAKKPERKNKMMLVDATTICTPLRAQNTMSEDDIQKAYKLYADYQDVIDYAKVVTIDEVAAKDYSLSVASYIEKKQAEMIDPAIVRMEYMKALEEVKKAEDKMRRLLIEGGYISE